MTISQPCGHQWHSDNHVNYMLGMWFHALQLSKTFIPSRKFIGSEWMYLDQELDYIRNNFTWLFALLCYKIIISFLLASEFSPNIEVLEDGVCSIIEHNLGLASYWWIIPFIQLFVYLLLFSLQTLCNLATILRFITINSINTFYLNISLWTWLVFALIAMTYCRIGKLTVVNSFHKLKSSTMGSFQSKESVKFHSH